MEMRGKITGEFGYIRPKQLRMKQKRRIRRKRFKKDRQDDSIVYRPEEKHALIIIIVIFQFIKSMELLAYSDDIALSFTVINKISK